MSASKSRREPQFIPSDHCYSIIQDHGLEDGGWGPAAIQIGFLPSGPVVYTGSDESILNHLKNMAEKMARDTGKPTRLVRYHQREDVASFGEE